MSHKFSNTTLVVDYDSLREQDNSLWKAISKATGFEAGDHNISFDSLAEAYAGALYDWYLNKYLPATQAKPKQPDNTTIGTKAEEAAKAEQRRKDEVAARARLEQYYGAPNYLLKSDQNLRRIQDWLNQNVRGYWSASAIDVAIRCLGPRGRNYLQWGKAPEPPKPAVPLLPVAPPEVLGTCSDGEPQLPIDSPMWVLKKSTPAQIRDWQKRRMERDPKEGIITRGFFGSRHGG